MGTSGAFGGSAGKNAKDLRDSIAAWLTDAPSAPQSNPDASDDADGPGEPGTPAPSTAGGQPFPQTAVDLRPTIRILVGRGGGGDGPGGGAGGRSGGGSGGGGRSTGGARRSLGGTSRAVGRAGAMARAYAAGDTASLTRLGLNYNELLALGNIVAVGAKIVEAAFSSQANSTIEDDESREVVAEIVEWILEAPADMAPTPEEIVRRSIQIIIADVTLTEVGDRIRQEPSREKRANAEQEIRDAAEIYANQVTLSNTGASEQEMAAAIEGGIEELGRIFGGRQ